MCSGDEIKIYQNRIDFLNLFLNNFFNNPRSEWSKQIKGTPIGFQHLTYLAGESGLRVDYNFDWNTYGPFSDELALELISAPKPEIEKFVLRDSEKTLIEKLKNILPDNFLIKRDSSTPLASLAFIARNMHNEKIPTSKINLKDRFNQSMPKQSSNFEQAHETYQKLSEEFPYFKKRRTKD